MIGKTAKASILGLALLFQCWCNSGCAGDVGKRFDDAGEVVSGSLAEVNTLADQLQAALDEADRLSLPAREAASGVCYRFPESAICLQLQERVDMVDSAMKRAQRLLNDYRNAEGSAQLAIEAIKNVVSAVRDLQRAVLDARQSIAEI